MKLYVLKVSTVLMSALLSSGYGIAQETPETRAMDAVTLVRPVAAISSSANSEAVALTNASADSEAATTSFPSNSMGSEAVRPFLRAGVDLHVGLNGAGFDLAAPIAGKFNLRAGADFLTVSSSFQEQGADVEADLRLRSGHASLDWFPFGGRFRLSPQVVFANNNRVQATALIPAGSSITLNGQDYTSSTTDPLHGAGLIDFRKVSPGFTIGFGNIVHPQKGHFSIPVEIGFYYVGQPRLAVNFSGSACDPTQPPATGCQSVSQDADFQHNLAAFIARNNNNLSYASFFPVLSIGVGYSF